MTCHDSFYNLILKGSNLSHMVWPEIPQVIEEDQRLVALRVTGGTGGFGLTIGSNVDRSTVKDLSLGNYEKSGEFLVFWGLESIFWLHT